MKKQNQNFTDINQNGIVEQSSKSIFRLSYLLMSLLLAVVGAAIGLFAGYQFLGNIVYELFPSHFDEIYANQFPAELSSKIRSAAIIDVMIFCGWFGLITGATTPLVWSWLKPNKQKDNSLKESNQGKRTNGVTLQK